MKKKLMKTKAFTLVEIMIVVLIIGVLLAIALPNYDHARANTNYHAILDNLRRIDSAKERWGMDNGKSASDAPTVSDLVPAYLSSLNAPIPGTYVPNDLNSMPTFDGKNYAQWTLNCDADPTSSACGL